MSGGRTFSAPGPRNEQPTREPRNDQSTRELEGNGAGLVRARAMAAAVQSAIERVYRLEPNESVGAYLREGEEGEREELLVRDAGDGSVELSLRIPPLARPEFDVSVDGDLDPLCQLIEGVSHFVYVAERARADREATQLELELQAEVDKYVVLAGCLAEFDAQKSATLRERLYDYVSFEHDGDSPLGERYRVANDLAKRYVRRLERDYVAPRRFSDLRDELRRYYRLGQEEKLRSSRCA